MAGQAPIDIVLLREDQGGNPAWWRKQQELRFKDPKVVDVILEHDNVRRLRSTCAQMISLKHANML